MTLAVPAHNDPTRGSTLSRRTARVLQAVDAGVVEHEAQSWARAERLRIDITARAKLTRHALNEDLVTFERGMWQAGGDPVREELVLRYLDDQNAANRDDVRRF